jgi:arylsulfatase
MGHSRLFTGEVAESRAHYDQSLAPYNTWVADPMLKIIGDFEASLKKYPPIKLGTLDPYTPPQ